MGQWVCWAVARGGGGQGGRPTPPHESEWSTFGPDNQLSLSLHQPYCWMTRRCSTA